MKTNLTWPSYIKNNSLKSHSRDIYTYWMAGRNHENTSSG